MERKKRGGRFAAEIFSGGCSLGELRLEEVKLYFSGQQQPETERRLGVEEDGGAAVLGCWWLVSSAMIEERGEREVEGGLAGEDEGEKEGERDATGFEGGRGGK
ncbi:hypothetical protein HAX54_053153 [Datura stramonium]|uniref:Uncharacterized protein n=1 Tax=Datura stramonium TaxID=4076 RepID=A0ABS8WRL9_DATST|nr:hypothetical protein [Datura stramonium]